MGHIHNEMCCGQAEVHHHHAEIANHVGQLCCAGQCSHPEHQASPTMQQAQVQELLRAEQSKASAVNPERKTKTKKKPTKTGWLAALIEPPTNWQPAKV